MIWGLKVLSPAEVPVSVSSLLAHGSTMDDGTRAGPDDGVVVGAVLESVAAVPVSVKRRSVLAELEPRTRLPSRMLPA